MINTGRKSLQQQSFTKSARRKKHELKWLEIQYLLFERTELKVN